MKFKTLLIGVGIAAAVAGCSSQAVTEEAEVSDDRA